MQQTLSKWMAALWISSLLPFLQLIVMTSALSRPLVKQNHTMGTLPVLLASWERVDRMKDKMEIEPISGSDSKEDIYDFIVVGAGTGGSIVASRLADHFSVLLLEVGGQPHPNHENFAPSTVMSRNPETDWMYSSVVQNETCLLCPDRKYTLSAGKGLGGSGNLNYLNNMYEGAFQDYSEWMDATKDPGWGYYKLQPYFQKVKDYMRKKNPTVNDQVPTYRSTFKALIKLNSKLKIRKYSQVNKVLLGDNGRAIGVEYERHGNLRKAYATREIILSAGTYGSPKILMLSGIGSKDVLDKFKIPVHVSLPAVGKNFQDHLAIPLGPFFMTSGSSTKATSTASSTMPDMTNAWNSTRILRMPLINFNVNVYSKEMSHFLGIQEEVLKKYMNASHKLRKSNGSGETMFINVALKKPLSRGEVTLAGNNPKQYPIINPNYLNGRHLHDILVSASDKQMMIQSLEETVRLMENSTSFKAKFTDVSLPGCGSHIFRGYGYWDCYIRHFSMSLNHGVGTCSMGHDPSTAVVDPELKVFGVRGLRVIDASVMPSLISTFPFETVAVIAEKGSDMILKHYKSLQTPIQRVDLHEDTKQDAHFYPGFRIKKLSVPTAATSKQDGFSVSKLWQKADQIIYQAVGHHVGSTLADDDLLPPEEPPTKTPNPTYYPVRPLAGRLIFHPLIPPLKEEPDE